MPLGIPNPINAVKDIISKIEPNIPTKSGPMPLGKYVWETAKATPSGARWFVFGGKSPFDTGEGEPFLEQIKTAKTKEQAQAVIDTYSGGEPLASDNMLKTLRDKGLLSRVYPGLANPGPGLSLDPNSDTGAAYIRVGAMHDVRGMDPYNVYDAMIQEAFSGNTNLQLAYMRETDPLGAMPTFEQAFSANDEKSHNTIKDRLGRILGGGGKSLLNVFTMFERTEELLGQAYYYNKVNDPAMRNQMSTKFYNLAVNPWDSNRTQQKHALNAIKGIESQGLTGEKASDALSTYFKENPLGLTSMFADIIDQVVLDPLWFLPLDKIIATPIKAVTGAPEVSRLFRLLAPGVGAVKKAESAKLLEVGGEFGWKQILKLDNAAWAAGKWTSTPKGVTRILTTRLPHLGGEEAQRQLLYHTNPVAGELWSNTEHIMDLAQSIVQGKAIGFVERRIPGLLDNSAIAQLHAVSKGNEEFFTRFTKALSKPFSKETGEQTTIDVLDGMIAAGGEQGAKAATEKSLFLSSQLGNAAYQTMDSSLRKLYNSTKLGRFLLQKQSPFVTALKWPVMMVTINNPGFIYLNLVANYARHMWQAGAHPIEGTKTFAKSVFYEFGRRGVSAADHPFANLYRGVGLDPLIVELTVSRNAALEQLMAHGGVNVAEEMTGKAYIELLTKQARQPIKDILQQPSIKRRFLDVLFAPTYLAGKMDIATRRATHALALREQLHWGMTASWIKNAAIFPTAAKLEGKGISTETARLTEDMLVDRMRSAIRRGEPFTEQKAVEIWEEVAQHFELGAEGRFYSVRNTARKFAESKGYSAEEAIPFTQDLADFNATIYDDVLVEGLGKLTRGEITPKQLKNMLDAHVLDYYTAHDQIAAMANVPSFWRPETTYQDALRMNERVMRDDMADIANHLERHNQQVIYPLSELKLTKREFHRLVGLNTVENTKDLAAINQFVRDAAKATGELPVVGKAAVGRFTVTKPNQTASQQVGDFTVWSRQRLSGEVEIGFSAGVEANAEKFREVRGTIAEAFREAVGDNPGKQIVIQAYDPKKEGPLAQLLREHGMKVSEEGVVTAEEIAAPTLAQMYKDYFANKLERHNLLYEFEAAETGKRSLDHLETIINPWHEATLKAFKEHQEIITKALSQNTDEAWKAAAQRIKKMYEELSTQRGQLFKHGVNDLPSAAKIQDATGPQAALIDEYATFLYNDIRKNITKLRKGALELEPGAALIPSTLRGMAKDSYAHWSAAREQMLSNAMAKTDFVMLNYNQQYGLDRVFQAFIPFIFWPSRDSINWGIRAARSPGAAAGLLAAMQAPKDYAEQYGYPKRLQFQIPIPMPFLDDILHDMPIVQDLLADVNFGPVYWVDPMRFITPMADYRQSYSNEKRRGTPMGLASDWLENYTPFSINPFMKILGTETGLLDSDAWASTQFNGGPFGIPLTLTAQLADRWLRGGDLDAIPESEQYTYCNKGHFSIPFLNKTLGLEPDAGDIYRAERSAWGLALQDKLLPGKPHEEQVRAAMEAVDTHKGVAWERALRSSTEEAQLRQITAWIGFPFGGVTGVNEGEYVWMSLQQAYSAYAEKGQLDKFFEKYPEFEVRSAVVKGMDDPEEKQIAIDNELYHQDVDKLITKPYAASIEEIEGRLDQLAHMDQTTPVRDQRQLLLDEISDIRSQQSNLYDMLDKMYPKHIQELSLNHPPRERALMKIRDEWQAIRQQEGESWEEYRQRQEEFLSQFPPEEKGWGLQDWQDSYQAYLLTQIDYNLRTRKAADSGNWDDFDSIKQQREDRLTALHEQSMDGKLSRGAVESYLASWNYPKSPEQLEFDKAKSMMNMWMGLVGDGSMLTSREKGAVSDYFRAQPLIQKHYPLEVIPFEDLTINQRLDMMRRDEIWSTYYSMSTSENRLDYIRTVSDELNAINKRLGFPPLNVIDYEAPPPELGMGDPTIARLEMMSTAARKRALIDNAGEEELDEETLKSYEELLAVDPNDPSPLTSQGLDWHLRQFVDPNQK